MLFERKESFRDYVKLYPVTFLIFSINLIVFLLDKYFFDRLLTIKGHLLIFPNFDPYGLLQPYRYVTSLFLHADWSHILFNSFALLVFAPPLERLWGRFRYFCFYLLAGIAGNVLTTFVNTGKVYASLGASGAIYGMFGAFLFLAFHRPPSLDYASKTTVIAMLVMGLLFSLFSSEINISAHIGGAIAGFCLMSSFVTWGKFDISRLYSR